MKDFRKDLVLFENKLTNGDKFAFSKYADGEYAILRNQKITNCDNWTFDPNKHSIYQKKLLESFTYDDDEYYVGISCPCCVPSEDVMWMKKHVNVSDDRLTWANIFVNGNYSYYKNNIIPLYNDYDVILIANHRANVENLPFNLYEYIPISDLAWVDNFNLIDLLSKRNDENKLYLFSAGPLGNMLAYEMWKNNKNNTYLDIGSTLNNYIIGANRGYLKGAETLNKICIW